MDNFHSPFSCATKWNQCLSFVAVFQIMLYEGRYKGEMLIQRIEEEKKGPTVDVISNTPTRAGATNSLVEVSAYTNLQSVVPTPDGRFLKARGQAQGTVPTVERTGARHCPYGRDCPFEYKLVFMNTVFHGNIAQCNDQLFPQATNQ